LNFGVIGMRVVRVEDSVGTVLGHDLTKIVPGEFKGAAFKKGHVIRLEDIETLKSMGKYHINTLEVRSGELHENEAAERISRAIGGEGIYFVGPSEGKIELKASIRGLIKINVAAVNKINEIESVTVSTIHNNTLVEKDQTLAATRIIPLIIDENRIIGVEEIRKELESSIITVKELAGLKAGIVVVGTEVFEGRIKDRFRPVMREKLNFYGCELVGVEYAPDNTETIESKIVSMIEKGAEVVLTCGGMSVDADDLTPLAIKNVSDRVVSYGVPAMPGNMLMLAYRGNTAIFGIPGAAMHVKTTSLDLLLPRVLAGDVLSKKDITIFGHGGLCLGCKECRFPACSFGK
jgi:molybdenum cofactor synthesis domain-containing protein